MPDLTWDNAETSASRFSTLSDVESVAVRFTDLHSG